MRRALLTAAATVLASASLATAANAATNPTVITFGFDDGTADHVTTVMPLLDKYGFKATFFVNSGNIGDDRGPYMSWQDLHTLQNDGQEVGGHTVNHTNLTTSADPKADVCDDLANLKQKGIAVTSFAYPYGAFNGTVEAVLKDGCGSDGSYTSARTTQGIDYPCTDLCAMPLPFASAPFRTDALQYMSVSGASAADLINAIRSAHDAGGGWLPLVLHGVCTIGVGGCVDDGYTLDPDGLDTVLAFLKTNAVSGCYLVKTTAQVVAATTPFSCPAAPPSGGGGGGGGGGGVALPAAPAPVETPAPAADPAPVAEESLAAAATPPAPTVRLLSAPRKLLKRGIVRFRPVVTAAAGVAGIEYLVNGRVVARRTAGPYALTWRTTSKRARAARLSVQVTDRLGRVASVPTVTVRVAGRH
jgi:peptidoglycan/xylan/chitin deacetylase (PgdA/CDA1 family)